MMKALSPLLSLTLLLSTSQIAVRAQGTVYFKDFGPLGLNAPVYESDGVTPLSGPQFTAELLEGSSPDVLASIAITGFLTGAGAGYFNGGVQTINTVAPRTSAWFEVRVWNTVSGASFLEAQASGLGNSWWQSAAFAVQTGGGAINPFPPGDLTGLGNSPVYLNSVPEPTSIALAALGTAVVLFRFRRRERSAVSNHFAKP